jgi:hypothetical protein
MPIIASGLQPSLSKERGVADGAAGTEADVDIGMMYAWCLLDSM